MQKLDQVGFLTIAQNNSTTDYLRQAYAQAMSVKLTMPGSKYAVIVDEETNAKVTEQHRRVFDYVIQLPHDDAIELEWKLANEWQVCHLSPFKETIKVESDILFTRSIEHWLTLFRLKSIVLGLGCKDFQGNTAASRAYRQVFDENDLPDVYTGLMYFRYTKETYDFFNAVKSIFHNWDLVARSLKYYNDTQPTTDLVFAIAAHFAGVETCTLPGCDFINFAHMKNSINNWTEATPWSELVLTETDVPMIRINNTNQYHPLHYQDKTWLTDELIERYESGLGI